ncbi:MAG: sigma-70 family RNA polymerase sigma factor [Planctomycetes bacterium]|nr:sigma-70 family RNA polymerase sigma factor [Planctomycetota bacterium]
MNAKKKMPQPRTLETAVKKAPDPAAEQKLIDAEKLIEGCQGLVRSLAWKIHRKLPPYVDLDDLIAFGQLGLVQAAQDFEPERGGKFITYAYYRIRGSIFDGLSKMSWFNRHHYHSSRYEHMADELLRLEGDEDEAGGAGEAGETADSLESDLKWFKGVTSSLAVVYLASGQDRDEGESGPVLIDESIPSPSAQVITSELEEILHRLIDTLPSDAGSLIRGVYFEGLTLQEAGTRLGISKAWASRLHAKTLQRLAHSLRLIGVED